MNSNKGLDEMTGQDKMSKWFSRFAEQTSGSEMYQYLSTAVAGDADLLALAAKADQRQPVPNLFFAAINFLLYQDPKHPLAQYYPIHSGKKYSKTGLFESLKEFCMQNSEALTQIMKTRLVQTNEVRRCALLLPALAQVVQASKSEIALVDVRASSGLNLLLDQYFYDYSNGTQIGNPNSTLKISCTIRKGEMKLKDMPKIGMRFGIDLNPIDLNDRDEILWALALIWPDQIERSERLKAAIQILKNQSVDLRRGNALQILPAVADQVPSRLVLCVMHSFTLNQFSVEDRVAFENGLCGISKTRDVWRIGIEWLGTDQPQMNLDHYSSGKLTHRNVMANCHGHGEWIEFLNQ
jgi:hypothetical protein